MITSFAFIGFGAGNAQLAAFALPELLPNKWRHSAIVLADFGVFFAVVVGPVAGRFSIVNGESWRWMYYVCTGEESLSEEKTVANLVARYDQAPAICVATSFLGLYLFYYPPAHPRGLPTSQALRDLDYVGGILFILAATLTVRNSSCSRKSGSLIV